MKRLNMKLIEDVENKRRIAKNAEFWKRKYRREKKRIKSQQKKNHCAQKGVKKPIIDWNEVGCYVFTMNSPLFFCPFCKHLGLQFGQFQRVWRFRAICQYLLFLIFKHQKPQRRGGSSNFTCFPTWVQVSPSKGGPGSSRADERRNTEYHYYCYYTERLRCKLEFIVLGRVQAWNSTENKNNSYRLQNQAYLPARKLLYMDEVQDARKYICTVNLKGSADGFMHPIKKRQIASL